MVTRGGQWWVSCWSMTGGLVVGNGWFNFDSVIVGLTLIWWLIVGLTRLKHGIKILGDDDLIL